MCINTVLSIFLCSFYIQGADTQHNVSLSNIPLAFREAIIPSLNDRRTLQAVACINKCMSSKVYELWDVRRKSLKDRLKHCGVDQNKSAYTKNELCAYYVDVNDTQEKYKTLDQYQAALVSISHYGNDQLTQKVYEFTNTLSHVSNIFSRVKPFVLENAVYMYDAYSPISDVPGLLVRIPEDGEPEHVLLICTLYGSYMPSGWLARFLPKLHDELFNMGSKACRYYSRNEHECKVINKVTKNLPLDDPRCPYYATGVVIFDIASLTCISDNDKKILKLCTPEMCQSFHDDAMLVPRSLDELTIITDPLILMHMHVSWSDRRRVSFYLALQKNICYKIPQYGTFEVSAFTEIITFKPYISLFKKVKKACKSINIPKKAEDIARLRRKIIIRGSDRDCTNAFNYLEKKGAFVTKNWQDQSKGLGVQLEKFRRNRFIFHHNAQQAFLIDTVTNDLLVTTFDDARMPTTELKPRINILSFTCDKDLYTFEYLPFDDDAGD